MHILCCLEIINYPSAWLAWSHPVYKEEILKPLCWNDGYLDRGHDIIASAFECIPGQESLEKLLDFLSSNFVITLKDNMIGLHPAAVHTLDWARALEAVKNTAPMIL